MFESVKAFPFYFFVTDAETMGRDEANMKVSGPFALAVFWFPPPTDKAPIVSDHVRTRSTLGTFTALRRERCRLWPTDSIVQIP